MATFPERLRKLRKERKMTQAELAKALGVAMNTVSIWERGERPPQDDIFIKVAEYFGVPITYLAGISDNREWSELNDNEAFEAAEEEQRSIDAHIMEMFRDLSQDTRHLVQAVIFDAYRLDRDKGKLQSQLFCILVYTAFLLIILSVVRLISVDVVPNDPPTVKYNRFNVSNSSAVLICLPRTKAFNSLHFSFQPSGRYFSISLILFFILLFYLFSLSNSIFFT